MTSTWSRLRAGYCKRMASNPTSRRGSRPRSHAVPPDEPARDLTRPRLVVDRQRASRATSIRSRCAERLPDGDPRARRDRRRRCARAEGLADRQARVREHGVAVHRRRTCSRCCPRCCRRTARRCSRTATTRLAVITEFVVNAGRLARRHADRRSTSRVSSTRRSSSTSDVGAWLEGHGERAARRPGDRGRS